jgi:hypothetical protein
MRLRSVLFPIVLSISLAVGLSAIAFLVGRAAAAPNERYDQGVRDGEQLGRNAAAAEFASGSRRYKAIFARGREAGRREGRVSGALAARKAGFAHGRTSAFKDFPGGWKVGSWYAIAVGPSGEPGFPYVMSGRVAMRPGRVYGLCGRAPQRVCEAPAARRVSR